MSQQKHKFADDRIIDVDGNRQECPECGSLSCELIPFTGDEFSGASFVCYVCSATEQFHYTASKDSY